ncbi:MAG: DUF423 domain-containing protein [Bacteroidetes bacterium]|jgi:uncharacterized membrane protein YgdD (TMEM256/DUF423 family)|nr:DUF423 domain-containing protein [Bacteroidota bacterium]
MSRLFLALGALAAGIGVALGAFGAHGLESRVTPERLQTFETGVKYHMYHALALLVVGWAAAQFPGWPVQTAGYLFLAGIVLFSGSLYLLVLTDTPWLGAVTPLGGVAFIAGWALLAWGVLRGAGG